MKEQFLDFDLSSRLCDLGFDKPCFGYLQKDGDFSLQQKITNSKLVKKAKEYNQAYKGFLPIRVAAPLIQQAKTFLRERYGKFPVVYSDGFQWTYDLRWPDPTAILKDPYPGVMFPKYGEEDKREYFDTYQQAELRAIEKIIEFAENEKTE